MNFLRFCELTTLGLVPHDENELVALVSKRQDLEGDPRVLLRVDNLVVHVALGHRGVRLVEHCVEGEPARSFPLDVGFVRLDQLVVEGLVLVLFLHFDEFGIQLPVLN